MYRTSRHAALFVALLLKRSEKPRIRFSEKTFKKLAERERNRSAFILDVQLETMNLGVVLVELNRGGFGAGWASAFEGAPSVTAKALIPLAERKTLDEYAILAELDLPEGSDDDD